MRAILRAVLVLGLLLGVYALGAAIVAVLAVITWLALAHGYTGGGLVLGGTLVVTTVGIVLAFAQRSGSVDEPPGISLAEADQPRLWAEVRELAGVVRTRPPDDIRLVGAVNAAVAERSRLLGVVPGHRTMVVGVPLVMGMSRQQLRAVLAHELGHYSRRHTALGGVTHRGRATMGNVIEHFGHDSGVGRIFRAYAAFYLSSTAVLGRQQELEADGYSAEVAGRDAAVGAFRELPVVDAAWEHYLDEFVNPVHATGKRPTDFFDGFGEVLAAPRLQEALRSFSTDFDEHERGRLDTHPPLSTRIARLEGLPADGVREDDGPAVALLDRPADLFLELQEWMYREAPMSSAPWRDLLVGHEPADVRERAFALYRAVRRAESRPDVTLGLVVDGVRGRHFTHWVRGLVEDPTVEQVRDLTQTLLVSVVEEALMSVAGARVTLQWDADPRLVSRTGVTLEVGAVVSRAIEACSPAVLGDWLAEHGVGLDHRPDLPEPEDPSVAAAAAAPRPLEAIAPVSGRGTRCLVVLNQGVLLRRGTFSESLVYWVGGRHAGRRVVRSVLARTGADLLAEEGGTFLPWDRITALSVRKARSRRPVLSFTTSDGNTHAVRYGAATRDSGETFQALLHFLGERVALDRRPRTATRFRQDERSP